MSRFAKLYQFHTLATRVFSHAPNLRCIGRATFSAVFSPPFAYYERFYIASFCVARAVGHILGSLFAVLLLHLIR